MDSLPGLISPYPGDSVCPTPRQFFLAYRSSHKFWMSLISEVRRDPNTPSIIDSLLDLLRRIPRFQAQDSKAFLILDQPYPQIKLAFEWLTTTDPVCSQPVKRTHHYRKLTIAQPISYSFSQSHDADSCCPHINHEGYKHLAYLIFGWAFILSSRWAETLRQSGEDAFIHQSAEISDCNFWDVIARRPWQAGIMRAGKVFSSPWSFINHQTAVP